MKTLIMIENYRKSVLENGIRVVTEKIDIVRSISIGVWILAGTRDESANNNGISHFIEHMVFKGTKTRTAYNVAHYLESLGGSLNAFTGKELTCYYAKILDEHLEEAVDIISDIILNPRFDKNDIEKEKKVVVDEIKELEDTPGDLIHDFFFKNIYPDNPLGFSILGSEKNIWNFSKDHLLDYKRSNYTTDRIIISAAGNLVHTNLIKLIEKYFDISLSNGSRRITPPLPIKKISDVIESSISQVHICIGARSFPFSDGRRFQLLVLNTILGGGMSSRLFQNIREKYGLAYSIYSFADFFMDTGIIGVYVSTEKGKEKSVIELINGEFENLKNDLVSDDEMKSAKAQLKGGLILSLENMHNRMNRMAKMEIYLQRFYTIDEIIKYIDMVTKEQLIKLADLLFDKHSLQTTILKPSG
ncbi:MAG: M16 family metallopeptidase [Fidelibacterota bacterium]